MHGHLLGSALLGCLLALSLPELPSLWWCLLAPATACLGWCLPRMAWLAWACGAFVWTLFRMHLALDWIDADLQERLLTVSGQVTGLPRVEQDYAGFEFRIDSAVDQEQMVTLPKRLKLSWYNPTIPIHPQQRLVLNVKLIQPHARLNPGSFDAERMAVLRRIQGYGKVVSLHSANLPQRPALSIDRLRDQLSQKIAGAVPGPTSSLLQGLVLADRRAITDAQWSTLRQTGTAHLMAVSGLHVGTIAALGWYIGIGLGWIFAQRSYRLTHIHLSCISSAALALGYAALAGFTLPTQRALTMLALLYLVRSYRWHVTNIRILRAVVLLTLCVDPLVLMGVSFWLSFGAAWVLIQAFEGRLSAPGKVRSWLIAQGNLIYLSVMLGYLFFATVPWAGPLANLICIPVVSLVVLPLALAGTVLEWLFGAGQVFLAWSAQVLELVMVTLDYIALYAPAITRTSPDGDWWQWGAAFLGLLLISKPHPLLPRPLLCVFLVPMMVRPAPELPASGFDAHILDVGQGLAVVVETRSAVIVYDTGRISPSGANSGEDILVPFLQSRDIQRVDLLIISHGDADHAGGLEGLLRTIPANHILTSSPQVVMSVLKKTEAFTAEHALATRIQDCTRGTRWASDGVTATVWHPYPGLPYLGNDSSCVVRIASDAGSLLLPGDVSSTAEAGLLGDPLASDVLIAPHHGSATSSSRAFVRMVQPTWVVFTAGFKNPFDFPREAVQERYRRAQTKLANTFDSGMITYRFRANQAVNVQGYREANPRWWRKQPELPVSTRPGIRNWRADAQGKTK